MRIVQWCLAAALAVTALAAEKGFVTLFNGKDLKGWTAANTAQWVVEEGALALKNRDDGKEHNDSYLWTERTYGDFVLEIEYKAPAERANSGIFLRTSDKNDPVQTGIEIQVGNVNPTRPLGRGSVGGIYDLVAPAKALHRPGEWNRYVITCQGARLSVMLNGELTAEADLDQWTEAGKNPDGSKNKFTRPLKDFAREGYLGLQDHGLPVSYRNIRLKLLGR